MTEEAFDKQTVLEVAPPPYPFETADELLALCQTHQLSIHELMMKNECAWRR